MRDLFNKFKNGLFTKAQFLTGVTIITLSVSAVVYAFQSLNLNVFSPGTPISSTQVNDNFQQLSDAIMQMNNKFGVTLTTPITINSTFTDVDFQFDSTAFDFTPYSYSQQLMGTNAFTIQEDGLYEMTMIGWMTTLSACCGTKLFIETNGFPNFQLNVIINSNIPQSFTERFYFNSGDVISFQLYQGADGVIQPFKTSFTFEKIQ